MPHFIPVNTEAQTVSNSVGQGHAAKQQQQTQDS